jgi:aminoglycoside phosphotransferase (APT) family kinase protein
VTTGVLLPRVRLALADRYTIERELGRGGMSVVYLAHDEKLQRKAAVKVLHPEIAGLIGVERFEREIAICARLSHPHILPLYDSGEADGLLYYVMPFVDGESLRERLERDGPMPATGVAALVREVASALAAAHAEGIVHREHPADARTDVRFRFRHRAITSGEWRLAAHHGGRSHRRHACIHKSRAGAR